MLYDNEFRIRNLGEYVKRHQSDKKIIVFGASDSHYYFIKNCLSEVKIHYIIDNNADMWGTKDGIDIYPPDYLLQEEKGRYLILILSSSFYKEMSSQLEEMGIYDYTAPHNEIIFFDSYDEINSKIYTNRNNIQSVSDWLYDDKSKFIYSQLIKKRMDYNIDYSDICENNQYFINEILPVEDDEIYLDVGTLDGDTIEGFINYSNHKYSKIYGFEPNADYYKQAVELFKDNKNIKIYPYAAYDKNTSLFFSVSKISDNDEGVKIEAKTIDSLIEDRVTFIKMDIEGAEQNALLGAEEIIIKNKPKLAICIYHKTEDLWEIPILIKKMVPEYLFFVRHHRKWHGESVLYAIMPKE